MDEVRNPYAPGAGVQPPELAGRDALLNDARIALARLKNGRSAQSLILTGLRGVGKTVVLNRIHELAKAEGYVSDLMEAPESRRLSELLLPTLRRAARQMSHAEKAKDLFARAVRVLKSFTLSAKLAETEFTFEYDPETGIADSGDIERDLADVFESVGTLARESGSGLALLIDELQYLKQEDYSALIVATHRASQRGLPIFVAGAGLPSLPGISGAAKSYSERLFEFPRIGALSHADALKALVDPVNELGVTYDDDALEFIVHQTQRYPYFLQEWGYGAWNVAPSSPIRRLDAESAHPKVLAKLDQSFFRDWCNPVSVICSQSPRAA
ncbi:MAG: ATP-binding protein [Silvanigrellales bacterium]|nr:ATP-binding protein [Silvanigrellales bacterium]